MPLEIATTTEADVIIDRLQIILGETLDLLNRKEYEQARNKLQSVHDANWEGIGWPVYLSKRVKEKLSA